MKYLYICMLYIVVVVIGFFCFFGFPEETTESINAPITAQIQDEFQKFEMELLKIERIALIYENEFLELMSENKEKPAGLYDKAKSAEWACQKAYKDCLMLPVRIPTKLPKKIKREIKDLIDKVSNIYLLKYMAYKDIQKYINTKQVSYFSAFKESMATVTNDSLITTTLFVNIRNKISK